jgi:small nuclear ribonucleoprotein (snRNP)-like protein
MNLRGLRVVTQGFDEYMNIVLDSVDEITIKTDRRVHLGRILLKGDTITMLTSVQPAN